MGGEWGDLDGRLLYKVLILLGPNLIYNVKFSVTKWLSCDTTDVGGKI